MKQMVINPCYPFSGRKYQVWIVGVRCICETDSYAEAERAMK